MFTTKIDLQGTTIFLFSPNSTEKKTSHVDRHAKVFTIRGFVIIENLAGFRSLARSFLMRLHTTITFNCRLVVAESSATLILVEYFFRKSYSFSLNGRQSKLLLSNNCMDPRCEQPRVMFRES